MKKKIILWLPAEYQKGCPYVLGILRITYGVYVTPEMVIRWTQLPVQSVHITTNVVSSNPTHGLVHSIQQYNMIKFVSDLRQVGGFLRVLWCLQPIKQTTT
jgi:hypothetical protein